MPIYMSREKLGSSLIKRSMAERISTGNVVPVISNEVMADLILGGQQRLVDGYADWIQYPLTDREDLLKMAKFRAINEGLDDWSLKSDYLNYLKNHLYFLRQDAGLDEERLAEAADQADNVSVSKFAQLLDYLTFQAGAEDPLLILADLPLPIYITTCYHTFLEEALRRAQKNPRTEVCRWHPGLDTIPSVFDSDYKPTREEPLVFHLLGVDERPDSLVVTEDDFLRFLVAVSQDRGDRGDPIPSRVRQAMSDSALLLLGFGLSGWPFRVLFWGMVKPAPGKNQGVCCLQLKPSEVERKYLEQYLKTEAEFEIFWGDIQQYAQELLRLRSR